MHRFLSGTVKKTSTLSKLSTPVKKQGNVAKGQKIKCPLTLRWARQGLGDGYNDARGLKKNRALIVSGTWETAEKRRGC